METKTYRGILERAYNGDEDEVLRLSGDEEYLAERVRHDMQEFGEYLSVRYWIADKEMPLESLQEAFLMTVMGLGDAKCLAMYSEDTGYLWTDEYLRVGGHDLIPELTSNVGKFCHLEIGYAKSPPV